MTDPKPNPISKITTDATPVYHLGNRKIKNILAATPDVLDAEQRIAAPGWIVCQDNDHETLVLKVVEQTSTRPDDKDPEKEIVEKNITTPAGRAPAILPSDTSPEELIAIGQMLIDHARSYESS